MLFDILFSSRNNASNLFPEDRLEPEMNTSVIVFRKLATSLSLPISGAMVATPADRDSNVIFRSGHAIGWSIVTWPSLGSISGWNHDCHARLAVSLLWEINTHGGIYISNMGAVRLRCRQSILRCFKLMNQRFWWAKRPKHFHVTRNLQIARAECIVQ